MINGINNVVSLSKSNLGVQNRHNNKFSNMDVDKFERQNISFGSVDTSKPGEYLKHNLEAIGLPEYQEFGGKKLFTKFHDSKVRKHNSSEQIQQQTLKCVDFIHRYLKNEYEKGTVETIQNSIGNRVFKLEDGTCVSVNEPHNMYMTENTPDKTLTISYSSDDKIALYAWNVKVSHVMHEIMSLTEK